MQCYSIKLTDLKAKYLRAGGMKKIRDFCNRGIRKEAGEIEVNPFKEREFMKFKVRGSGDFLSALRLIQGEFIRRDVSTKARLFCCCGERHIVVAMQRL